MARPLLISTQMNSPKLQNIAILVASLLASSACNRAPTTEDIRIGRQAISLDEVSLLARTGYHKEALSAVKERHVPELLDAAAELQFRGFAKEELLAALRDSSNILTPAQKDVYDEAKSRQTSEKEQAASKQSLQVNNTLQQAYAASSAEQNERDRRERLSQATLRVAEDRQLEQASRERELSRRVDARWNSIEAQNNRNVRYSTPPRRYHPSN